MIDRDQISGAALALLSRDQLGRDFFARGVAPKVVQIDTLPDLVSAYARIMRQPRQKPPASAADVIPAPTPPADPARPLGGLFLGVE